MKKRRRSDHPVIKEYVLPKISAIQEYVNMDKNTKVLDVGCGNGFFTYYFDKICNVYGIDFSEQMIAMNPVKNTTVMNAENIGFMDKSFDIVFCHALLHHVEDVDKVINEMKRVTRRYLIFLEPNRNNPLMFLFSLCVKEEWRAMRFSLCYMKKIITRNKLDIIKAFSYGLIVPNKTPIFALPLLRLFNFPNPFGITNFLIVKIK